MDEAEFAIIQQTVGGNDATHFSNLKVLLRKAKKLATDPTQLQILTIMQLLDDYKKIVEQAEQQILRTRGIDSESFRHLKPEGRR